MEPLKLKKMDSPLFVVINDVPTWLSDVDSLCKIERGAIISCDSLHNWFLNRIENETEQREEGIMVDLAFRWLLGSNGSKVTVNPGPELWKLLIRAYRKGKYINGDLLNHSNRELVPDLPKEEARYTYRWTSQNARQIFGFNIATNKCLTWEQGYTDCVISSVDYNMECGHSASMFLSVCTGGFVDRPPDKPFLCNNLNKDSNLFNYYRQHMCSFFSVCIRYGELEQVHTMDPVRVLQCLMKIDVPVEASTLIRNNLLPFLGLFLINDLCLVICDYLCTRETF